MVIIKIIGAIVASFGFCILFRLNVRHMPFAALCAVVSCVLYYVFNKYIVNPFLVNMFASFAVALLSEIFARICKAPSTVFLLPGCISLVPGGTLYYSMNNLINGFYSEASTKLILTLEIGLGISAGIVLASLVTRLFIFLSIKSSKKSNEKGETYGTK